MILVRLREWKAIDNSNHIATTWQIASDEAMENIIEQVEQSTTMVNFLVSNIEVPVNLTYYIRAKRHFDTGKNEFWSSVIPVTNIKANYDDMLFKDDIIIQQPSVGINKEELTNVTSTLTIKTSAFSSNLDIHEATHYFILDSKDNILFSKLNDKENKTSITIPNDATYRDKSEVKFVVIHVGVSGVESKPGIKKINLNGNVNFEIENSISNLEPNTDLTIKFKQVDTAMGLNIIELRLLDLSREEVILEFELDSSNSIFIPWYLLKEGMKYSLEITALDINLDRVVVYKTISVADYSKYVIRDYEFEYKFTFDKYTEKTHHIPNGIYTEEMYNGTILIPDVDTKDMKIYKYNNDAIKIEDTTKIANGIKLLSNHILDMVIKPISKSVVFVDMLSEQQKPTFCVYSYDNNTDSYTLTQSLERTDEETCLGRTLSILQVTQTEIYYIPVGTNKIKKYNIRANMLQDVATIALVEDTNELQPMETTPRYIMLRNRGNRLFIGNGMTYNASMFNTETNLFEPGYTFSPESFVNKPLWVIPLINGSSLIVKLEENNEDTSTDGDFEYFDYYNGSFKLLNTAIDGENPRSAIVLNNGRVFLSIYSIENSTDATTAKTEFLLFS